MDASFLSWLLLCPVVLLSTGAAHTDTHTDIGIVLVLVFFHSLSEIWDQTDKLPDSWPASQAQPTTSVERLGFY